MIIVTVVLPSVRIGSQELRLHALGSVVRVETGGSITGYAIECNFRDIEEMITK